MTKNNQKSITHIYKKISLHKSILILIIFVSILSSFILSFGPLNYHGQLGWRTIHSRMMARELDRNNFNVFETKVYCRGTQLPYVQGLPVYELTVAFFYKIFGEHQIIARFISTICFGISLILIYYISLLYLEKWYAIFAVFLYGFSGIILSFSNQIQPTSMEIMLILLIFFFLYKYIDKDNNKYLITWGSLFILLCLTKITYGIFLAIPILILLLREYHWKVFTRPKHIVFAATAATTCLLWYGLAVPMTHPIYQETFKSYFTDIFNWIFVENKLVYIFRLYRWGSGFFLESISVLGLILLIIGLIKHFTKKEYFLPSMFISFTFLWILLPYKFYVHPYNFLLLLIPSVILAASGLQLIFNIKSKIYITISIENQKKKLKTRLNPTRLFKTAFSIVFIFYFINSNFMAFKKLHQYDYEYMRNFCRCVNEQTNSTDKVIFANQHLATNNLWQNEYSYESDRLGWPMTFPSAFSPARIMDFVKIGANALAICNTENEYPYKKMSEFHRSTYNWLYATFPLMDSYYEYYQLFDLSLMNKYEAKSDNGLKCGIDFNKSIKLEKIIGRYNAEKNRIEIKFLWKCLSEKTKYNYNLLAISEKPFTEQLSHRILGKQYGTSMWNQQRYYSEWIYIDKPEDGSMEWSFIPVLYNPIEQDIMLPISIDYKNPMLTIRLADQKVIIKIREADNELKKIASHNHILADGIKWFHENLKQNLQHRDFNTSKIFSDK